MRRTWLDGHFSLVLLCCDAQLSVNFEVRGKNILLTVFTSKNDLNLTLVIKTLGPAMNIEQENRELFNIQVFFNFGENLKIQFIILTSI